MKRFVVFIIFFCFSLSVYASDMPSLKYKDIGLKSKIYYNESTDSWSSKPNKKDDTYYLKTTGFGNYYDYLKNGKNFEFTTNCEYEFITDGKFIGISNKDLKFYEITYLNGLLLKRPLSTDEIQKIFPDYQIIKISSFSGKTNSYKIKKHIGNLKIILINDTNTNFDGYKFSSGNAKFEQYDLNSFLTVTKPGMIQFSKNGESNYSAPWYILLIR